jgi:glycosyltransferase involved in cell wall biosynthesis
MLGRADLVVASSPAMRDHLSATVRGRARILLVPNPVDVAALRAAAAGTDVPPVTSGPASARLVAVGRLIDIKAHDELLHALAESSASHTLTIVGDGPLRSHLEALAGRLGLSDRVELVGHIDDPGRLAARVAAADLLVHPSRFEGMPNAVLEALALGTPVLATTDLEVLADLANEVGPVALRLVDRERLATALATVRPAGPDPTPRLSLLPERFHVDAVVRSLLAALSSLEERSGA